MWKRILEIRLLNILQLPTREKKLSHPLTEYAKMLSFDS